MEVLSSTDALAGGAVNIVGLGGEGEHKDLWEVMCKENFL